MDDDGLDLAGPAPETSRLALADFEQAFESGKCARARGLTDPDTLAEKPTIGAQLRELPVDGLGACPKTLRDPLPCLRMLPVPKEQDFADVLEREPDPLELTNELKTHECFPTVDPVTRGRSPREG